MAGFARCTFCSGFLHHSYVTSSGVNIYRCNQEDSFNDLGRYFIVLDSVGPVEVMPVKSHGEWSYNLVDTEKRRTEQQRKRIEEEIAIKAALYRKSQEQLLVGFRKDEELDQ